jgi:NTE family protein
MNNDLFSTSLVLGSGGARGLAHIGVIKALEESNQYNIKAISGSSIGSLIGGLYAGNKLEPYTEWVRGLSVSDVWTLLDFSFTSKGLFKGDRLMNQLADLVGESRIEDLEISFTAVASDIERREEIWINHGSLFEAIRASIAIPGIFTPVLREGRLLVDGGLLSPLPIAPIKHNNDEHVIVVSLNGNSKQDQQDSSDGDELQDTGAQRSRDNNLLQSLFKIARLKLGLDSGKNHSDTAIDIISKSLEAMQDRIARYQIAAYRPNLLIEIPVDACGVLEFHRADQIIELGYKQTLRAIRQNGITYE